MLGDEFRRVAIWFGIDEVRDVPLLPQFDDFRFVSRDMGVAHRCEQVAQNLRFRMSEFDKLKSVGACWIFVADGGSWCCVWKRAQFLSPVKSRSVQALSAGWQFAL